MMIPIHRLIVAHALITCSAWKLLLDSNEGDWFADKLENCIVASEDLIGLFGTLKRLDGQPQSGQAVGRVSLSKVFPQSGQMYVFIDNKNKSASTLIIGFRQTPYNSLVCRIEYYAYWLSLHTSNRHTKVRLIATTYKSLFLSASHCNRMDNIFLEMLAYVAN